MSRTIHRLPEEARTKLAAYVAAHGEESAAKLLGVAPGTLWRAIAGGGLRKFTVDLLIGVFATPTK